RRSQRLSPGRAPRAGAAAGRPSCDSSGSCFHPVPVLPHVVGGFEENIGDILARQSGDQRHADSVVDVLTAGMQKLPVPETDRPRWPGDLQRITDREMTFRDTTLEAEQRVSSVKLGRSESTRLNSS